MFLIHSRISFFRNVRKWKNCVNWIENKKKKIKIADEYENFTSSLIRDTNNDLIK